MPPETRGWPLSQHAGSQRSFRGIHLQCMSHQPHVVSLLCLEDGGLPLDLQTKLHPNFVLCFSLISGSS